MSPAMLIVPDRKEAERGRIVAGFSQVSRTELYEGMAAEVACESNFNISMRNTVLPARIVRIQESISSGQLAPSGRLIEPSEKAKRGQIVVHLDLVHPEHRDLLVPRQRLYCSVLHHQFRRGHGRDTCRAWDPSHGYHQGGWSTGQGLVWSDLGHRPDRWRTRLIFKRISYSVNTAPDKCREPFLLFLGMPHAKKGDFFQCFLLRCERFERPLKQSFAAKWQLNTLARNVSFVRITVIHAECSECPCQAQSRNTAIHWIRNRTKYLCYDTITLYRPDAEGPVPSRATKSLTKLDTAIFNA